VGAYIRNPERNFGNRLLFRVELKDGVVRLVSTTGKVQLDGTFDASAGRLSLYVPAMEETFDFTRRDRAQSVGLYPRTPSAGPYVYQRPIAEDDGWSTAAVNPRVADLREIGLGVQEPQSSELSRALRVGDANRGETTKVRADASELPPSRDSLRSEGGGIYLHHPPRLYLILLMQV
jgi:hypothetical protein